MYKVIIIWLVMWFVTWPAFLADFQQHGYNSRCEHYRHDLGFATFMALIPVSWLMSPFFTGFYEHGFQIFPDKSCNKELTSKNQ